MPNRNAPRHDDAEFAWLDEELIARGTALLREVAGFPVDEWARATERMIAREVAASVAALRRRAPA
jgi:hypothetical protein